VATPRGAATRRRLHPSIAKTPSSR